jgi:ADP-heptose:LPS heptosyltransferase
MAAVLVIKHGALGDFVMALGAVRAIREHHPDDRLILLTTPPYAGLAEASGYADEVWVDDRPKVWRMDKVLALRRRLRGGGFARVYDLQTSQRTGWYFRMLGRRKPKWSGIAPGCSHPDRNPRRIEVHTLQRLAEQLRQAGIPHVPPPALDFLDADLSRFGLPDGIALLVPGSAPHRPDKRWPAERYGELARALVERDGLTPVLIGTTVEADALGQIVAVCPGARDLGGRTGFAEIAALARRGRLAVGNDTGPMHLIAAAGCPALTLFSGASNPRRTAPGGPDAAWLQRASLADLPVEEVLAALPTTR